MKRIFTILLLLFASCENTDIRVCGCEMTFSDALPVQFWLQNCETFNEKEVDGVFPRCFCQPFNCDDEITVQLSHTPGASLNLFALDSDNFILFHGGFVEGISGLYNLSFTPNEENICDTDIQLIIFSGAQVGERIEDPGFDSGSGWSNVVSGGNINWAVSGSAAEANLTDSGGNGHSRYFSESFTDTNGLVQVRFTGQILYVTGIATNGTLTVEFLKDGSVISDLTYTEDFEAGSGAIGEPPNTVNFDKQILIEESIDQVRFKVRLSAGQGGQYDAFMSLFSVVEYNASEPLAKSDCLSIKENHEETILINYTNNRVFAGLNSAAGTPDPEFNLRIPAIFFEERYPKESEMMILSNSRSVQLNAQVKRQKWLKVKPMPFYMHLKTQLALVFQSVTIDEEEWILEEGYDLDPGNPRHPLRKANAWLTQKDYIVRNVL